MMLKEPLQLTNVVVTCVGREIEKNGVPHLIGFIVEPYNNCGGAIYANQAVEYGDMEHFIDCDEDFDHLMKLMEELNER